MLIWINDFELLSFSFLEYVGGSSCEEWGQLGICVGKILSWC